MNLNDILKKHQIKLNYPDLIEGIRVVDFNKKYFLMELNENDIENIPNEILEVFGKQIKERYNEIHLNIKSVYFLDELTEFARQFIKDEITGVNPLKRHKI